MKSFREFRAAGIARSWAPMQIVAPGERGLRCLTDTVGVPILPRFVGLFGDG